MLSELRPHLTAYLYRSIDEEDEDSLRVRWLFEEFHFLDISFIECGQIINRMDEWLHNHFKEITGYRPQDFTHNWRLSDDTNSLYLQDSGYT